ncbi:MAG: YbjN domain-containing protein [Xanthobacteraceae bacterium]
MRLIQDGGGSANNPLAIVERMALGNDWEFSRVVEDEITLAIESRQVNYHVSFSWMEDIKVLHFACAFEMKVPVARLLQVGQLITNINEKLWIGHFDVWRDDGLVMFRHSLLLTGGVSTSAHQCEAVLGAALDCCERYFPALHLVVWAGKSVSEAMDLAMFEVAGEA